jgi:hypothetical protein
MDEPPNQNKKFAFSQKSDLAEAGSKPSGISQFPDSLPWSLHDGDQ